MTVHAKPPKRRYSHPNQIFGRPLLMLFYDAQQHHGSDGRFIHDKDLLEWVRRTCQRHKRPVHPDQLAEALAKFRYRQQVERIRKDPKTRPRDVTAVQLLRMYWHAQEHLNPEGRYVSDADLSDWVKEKCAKAHLRWHPDWIAAACEKFRYLQQADGQATLPHRVTKALRAFRAARNSHRLANDLDGKPTETPMPRSHRIDERPWPTVPSIEGEWARDRWTEWRKRQ